MKMSANTHFLDGINEQTAPLPDIIAAVEEGFSTDVLGRVAKSYGLTHQAFAELIDIPPRSLQRRRETRLNKRESEKVLRFARLFQRAVEVFDDDTDSARQFLTEPQPALDGARPIDFARSEIGAAEVMDLLGRIDHGVYT